MSAAQVVAAVAAAVIAAGAVRGRRRLGTERLLIALLAAAGLAVYASGLMSRLPDAEKVITDLADLLGPWTYALVGGMAFLETGAFVGLIAPGEFTVILGGVIAGKGEVSLALLIGLVWLCAFLGDTTSFFIGRRLGRRFLIAHGPKVKITRERLEQVEGYFERHGGKTILIGRFVGLVRALAPFIAGSSRMSYASFAPYSIIGTGLWGGGFTVLGFIFYNSFSQIAHVAGQATLALGILIAVVAGSVAVWRRLRKPGERRRLAAWLDRQGRRPLLRPVAAVVRPAWRYLLAPAWRLAAPRLRFLLARLTPGNLGIEFTTVAAASGVGFYLFGLYASLLERDPDRLTPVDREALDLAERVQLDPAVEAVRVATALGSLPAVLAVMGVAVVLLAWRRNFIELVALVVGTAVLVGAVQLAKHGVGRPRPSGGLVEVSNSSFPSGHAAYATVYVALALVAARVLPGLISRAALVLGAVLLAGAIGVSRLYLQVHWWSDVAAGWALGAGIFGTVGALALVVAHVRHNEAAGPHRGAA